MRILAGRAGTRSGARSQIATFGRGTPLPALIPLINMMGFRIGRLASMLP
ncbi:MAG: hypothetical protein ABR926_27115 [Streptosporangiaceae bacterium]|jgi:hypothetical protein